MMGKKYFSALVLLAMAFFSKAQNLQAFTATLQTNENGSNYLGIVTKRAYTMAEAKANKSAVDFVLLKSTGSSKQKLEWYNMSGKDDRIPMELQGTSTVINAISFDREQFDKCKTTQDLTRMTGHITNGAFSHYASVGENTDKEITYHCFIIQLENGKRGLLWLDAVDSNTFKVMVKVQL